jgi:hypothetical protein
MDDEQLVRAFEAGEIDGRTFRHEQHLRVAWALSRRHDRDDAFARLATGLRGIAARAGRPQAYHETVTRAWFELVASVDDPSDEAALLDRGLLARYYSAERLAAGRERWLEPDLHPLRLPPPAAAAG